jgi:hypothetical protein
MKTRNIPKQFDAVADLGLENLYVSGCSFTYNNSEEHSVTWPYYLRDLGNFKQVYDSSLPGAGNYHIANSLVWTLERIKSSPNDTLVVVMWSGIDRDDAIISKDFSNDYMTEFEYDNNVIAGISGGLSGTGNFDNCRNLSKDRKSRSIENLLYYTTTYHYLKSNGYPFVFLEYLNPRIPNRTDDFVNLYQQDIDYMFDDIQTLYEFAIRNDLLENDDFHPSPDGHLNWTREVLLPYLVDKFK